MDPRDVKVAICEALDLDPDNVYSVTMDMRHGPELPTVHVEYVVRDPKSFETIGRDFELTPKERRLATDPEESTQ